MKTRSTLAILAGAVLLPLMPGYAFAGGKVNVLLQEWKLVMDARTISPGEVTFTVQNRGKETHEFVVFKTDLPFDNMPLKSGGGIDEQSAGEVMDEIEDIEAKTMRTLKVNLAPGNYVVMCNIVEVEGGTTEQHYAMGMRAPLVVK